MLDQTPAPGKSVIITDYTEQGSIGRQLSTLVKLALDDVTTVVFNNAAEAKQWARQQPHQPFLLNVMWPDECNFDSRQEWENELRQVGYLIWHNEALVLSGTMFIVVISIAKPEMIQAQLIRVKDLSEEVLRPNQLINSLLDQHRPLGEPRQPPITEYIVMGYEDDAAVERLLSVWAQCWEVANRARASRT